MAAISSDEGLLFLTQISSLLLSKVSFDRGEMAHISELSLEISAALESSVIIL